MDDASLSIFRDLDEIDACISAIKLALGDLEFDTSKLNLVIGGASSGAHLTMLYAYSRGQRSAIPIKFLINAVGPTDIKPENWKKFVSASDEVLNAGLSHSAIEAQRSASNLGELKVQDPDDDYYWNAYQTMRIANGMCGIPYSTVEIRNTTDENKEEILYPNEASNSMTKVGGGEDQVSVTYWMNQSTNSYPIVCAYAGKDSVVGIAQFAKLEEAMINKSIDYDFVYFKNGNHTDIKKEKDETKYNEFVNKILTRLAAI
jgi:acetyl esterase/lipase